ncbi:hypothetical protein [Methanolacinia paynteri]|uniref:hypothetical protein n=1 Tax=Methanolacinia paynteri TaxID=230356 RepID=UPI00064FCB1B|nr:hypothetical protein [Methanolacinia paynteri]
MNPENSADPDDESELLKPDPPEIIEANEKFIEISSNLLAKGIDFVKWTTTISIGAIIWIASSSNDNKWIVYSLGFFILAIVIAILIVYYVFSYWSWQVKSSQKLLKLLISNEEKYQKSLKITRPKILYNIFDYQESRIKESRFRDPYFFEMLIVLHLCAIIGGLIFYLRSFF